MKEISVRVWDDLDYQEDGTRNEACETVMVGLNGRWRELDLTEENGKEVRGTLERLMAAGSEPEFPVAPPSPASETAEVIERNRAIRAWCREQGLMNSSGSGYAYQTNGSLKDYIGKPLLRRYEAYLAGQQAAKEKR